MMQGVKAQKQKPACRCHWAIPVLEGTRVAWVCAYCGVALRLAGQTAEEKRQATLRRKALEETNDERSDDETSHRAGAQTKRAELS